MKFLECNIEGFGGLQSFRYTFGEGLNTIIADNGYGKTTLTVFIKCMLYGMEDTKRTALSENDRKHYMPWNGGRCGGSLSLEIDGVRYRIERSFDRKGSQDSFALYNLNTGKLSSDFSENIGEEALGIDRDGFERTIFLSERNLSGKNENKSISAKLSDLVGCDGDLGGMDAAMRRLDEARKYYKKTGSRGYTEELKSSIAECEATVASLERARGETLLLEERLSALTEEIDSLQKDRAASRESLDKMKALKSKSALCDQYSRGVARLNEERAELVALSRFFGDTPPTLEEIVAASYKLRDAIETERAAATLGESKEYSALAEKYEGKTDLIEVERISSLLGSLEEKRAATEKAAPTPPEAPGCFDERLPTSEELERARAIARRSSKLWTAFGMIALLSAIPLLFLLPIASAVLLAAGVILLFVSATSSVGRRRAISRLLGDMKVTDLQHGGELISYIDYLLAKHREYSEALSQYRTEKEQYEALVGEVESLCGVIEEFASRFECEGCVTLSEKIGVIKQEFLRYYTLLIGRESTATDRRVALNQAREDRRLAEEFLSRFPPLGENPFDKLREMLTKYNYLISSVAVKESECKEIKSRYGIEDTCEVFDEVEAMRLESECARLEGLITDRISERSALESRIAIANEDYDRIYELRERSAMLNERLREAETSLAVIVGARQYLTAAMENMTARYLGKARGSFENYRKMIEGEVEREFTLDTSFSLSVTEVGGTHQSEAYSRGTRDLYALATRLALSDALYETEPPPLILDDPFSSFDERRLSLALGVIKRIAGSRQIIYLTCHNSRKP